LHKINEKSRAGINGYFCIKPFIMEMAFIKDNKNYFAF
jgi:hypothetical protein